MTAPAEKPFPWKCGHCREKAVVRQPTTYSADVTHDGQTYPLEIPDLAVPTCQKCGRMVIDDAVNRRITEALRTQIGLLSPRQVRAGREALGLAPDQLAERLRVTAEDIAGWEGGTVLPPRAVDLLMRLYFGFSEVRSALADEARLRTLGEAAA